MTDESIKNRLQNGAKASLKAVSNVGMAIKKEFVAHSEVLWDPVKKEMGDHMGAVKLLNQDATKAIGYKAMKSVQVPVGAALYLVSLPAKGIAKIGELPQKENGELSPAVIAAAGAVEWGSTSLIAILPPEIGVSASLIGSALAGSVLANKAAHGMADGIKDAALGAMNYKLPEGMEDAQALKKVHDYAIKSSIALKTLGIGNQEPSPSIA